VPGEVDSRCRHLEAVVGSGRKDLIPRIVDGETVDEPRDNTRLVCFANGFTWMTLCSTAI
jgi:hypothetical protein